MPISPVRAKKHIEDWAGRAGRRYWPRYVFHHGHATAIAAAVHEQKLVSRALQQELVHDVAEHGALAVNPEAMKYVRMYFRPLNHFHLSTEGIKFRYENRRAAHMSIPVVLMFDALHVLTYDGAGFSTRKLAHIDEEASFDEAGFNAIEFTDVYHDGPPPRERIAIVNDRRMAEVIVPDTIELLPALKHIVCRTMYDEITLRHLTRNANVAVTSKIITVPQPSEMFFCWGTFIQLLEFSNGHLRLKLFQGRNYAVGKPIACRIELYSEGDLITVADFERELNNSGVSVGPFPELENSIWKISIEGCLAFEGPLPQKKSELIKG